MTDDEMRDDGRDEVMAKALRRVHEPPAFCGDAVWARVRATRAEHTMRRSRWRAAWIAVPIAAAAALTFAIVRPKPEPAALETATTTDAERAVGELDRVVRVEIARAAPEDRARIEADLAVVHGVIRELRSFVPTSDVQKDLVERQLKLAVDSEARLLRAFVERNLRRES